MIQNDITVFQTTTEHSHIITGLTPYSRHTIYVQICTAIGCTSSPVVEAYTAEEPPLGTVTMSIEAVRSREIDVIWTSPAVPNGPITFNVYFQGLFYVAPGKIIGRIRYFMICKKYIFPCV